jgi:hypothetical protein
MLPKKVVLRNRLQINMSLSIGDIYLKEVRTLLFVRMLTLNLQSLLRSIPTNKASLHVIIVAPLGTSGYTFLRSVLKSFRSRSKSQREVSLALNLPSLIMLIRKSDSTLKGVLPHVATMVRLATPRPNASS